MQSNQENVEGSESKLCVFVCNRIAYKMASPCVDLVPLFCWPRIERHCLQQIAATQELWIRGALFPKINAPEEPWLTMESMVVAIYRAYICWNYVRFGKWSRYQVGNQTWRWIIIPWIFRWFPSELSTFMARPRDFPVRNVWRNGRVTF